MQMTDGHGERVGGVVRRRRFVETEQQLDHLLHLVLLGAAVTDHRPLDLGRCVLDDLASRFDGGKDGDAARVSELQRAPGVDGVKQALDGDALGTAGGEPRDQLAVDPGKTLRERIAGERRDDAAGDKLMAPPVGLHAAVAGALGAGVDAENSHASDASISFSSMSKFAQTCCTSSWSSIASNSLSICCASLPCSLM